MSNSRLSAADIENDLRTGTVGSSVLYFLSLPSTMEVARKKAQSGAKDGTVIVASEQKAGRGRFARQWLSPPGSISLSVILRPDFASLTFMIMLSAVAVAKTIEEVTSLQTQLKWPNDVLINGKKVCGILTESTLKGNRVDYVIIGIGINVNMRMAAYPEIAEIATSLSDEMGYDLLILNLLRKLLAELDDLYSLLPNGEPIFSEWRQRMTMLDKRVQVISGTACSEGIAGDVERDGSLLLKLDDGSAQHILAGDISLRLV